MARWLGAFGLAALLLFVACFGDTELAPAGDRPDPVESRDAGGRADAAFDAPVDDVVEECVDAEAEFVWSTVVVGLYPTPVSWALGADPSVGEQAMSEALITALAAGARGVVVEIEWGQLLTEESWARLSAVASLLARERKQLFLSIPIVEALADKRPVEYRGLAWTSPALRSRFQRLIDQLWLTLGSRVAYVSFGMEVDVFLESKRDDASGVASFFVDGLKYARTLDGWTGKVSLGVTWSTSVWAEQRAGRRDELMAERVELVDVSDVVMIAHHAVDGDGRVQTADDAVRQIRDAVFAIQDTGVDEEYGSVDAGFIEAGVGEGGGLVDVVELADVLAVGVGKPVVLHRVAATSASVLGSSEAQQSLYLSQVFRLVHTLVDEGGIKVPFVGVAVLHDPFSDRCFDFANSRGPVGSVGLYDFWCASGIRDGAGVPKESFWAFMQGAVSFWAP